MTNRYSERKGGKKGKEKNQNQTKKKKKKNTQKKGRAEKSSKFPKRGPRDSTVIESTVGSDPHSNR